MANGVQIGALHISLSAESTAFDRGMNQAPATAQAAMDDVTAVTEDASNKIKTQALAIGAALAAAFAIDGIKDKIKEQIDYADGLADIAARTNQTTEALSAMEYALHFSDATLQDYTGGLQKLSENMVSAAQGSKAQAELFDVLGISVRDQNGAMRNAAEVMMDVSDELAKMEQGATQSNVAIDLLGKSAGPALLPALQQGSGAIQDLTDKAAKLNLVVGTETSNAAGDFNDSMDNMGFAVTGFWRVATAQLLPALTSISTNMLKASEDTKSLEGASLALSTAIKVMYTGFKASVIELEFLGNAIGKVSAVAVAAATDGWAAASKVWNDQSGNIKATAALNSLGDMWQEAGEKAKISGDQQAEAAAKAAHTLAIEKARRDAAAKEAKKDKDAKPDAQPKDNFQYGIGGKDFSDGSISATEYNNASTAEAISNATYVDPDQAANDAFFAMVDSELVAMDAANVYKLNAQQEFNNSWLLLDQDRINKVVTNGDLELEAKKAQMAANVSFFQNGLNSMAQGQSKAAKAAQAIQKAQALYEIGVNTYRAATGAYAALAPIPLIGPALGVAAAGLAIAFGASMAQGVLSGGSPSSVAGGAPSALSTSSDVIPRSEQRAQEQANMGITYIRVPLDRMMSGSQLIDFIDEVRADGKEFRDLRFIAA